MAAYYGKHWHEVLVALWFFFKILFVIIYFYISLYCLLLVSVLYSREALIVILDFIVI